MINCNKNTYKSRLALDPFTSEDRHSAEGILIRGSWENLRAPWKLLGEDYAAVLRGTADGRRAHPRMWLMALRAHTRGRLALRVPDLEMQGRILKEIETLCPPYFAGMLVEEEVVPATGVEPAASDLLRVGALPLS